MGSRRRRIVVPAGSLVSGELRLTGDLARHVARVLRRQPGDPLDVCDGAGKRAAASIVKVLREEVVVQVGPVEAADDDDIPRLTLIQGVGKGDKMDRVVRQATELGVRRIRPVHCVRSVREAGGRVERWRAVAEDSVRVSGRAFRPQIDPVRPLSVALASVDEALRLALVVDAKTGLREKIGAAHASVSAAVLVGPEGGLSTEECAAAEAQGFGMVHLGDRVLRTETAGLAALVVLQFALGGFERSPI